MGSHIDKKLYDNVEEIVPIIGAIVQLLFTDKIKFGFHLAIGHKNGAVCFVIDRIDDILCGPLLFTC